MAGVNNEENPTTRTLGLSAHVHFPGVLSPTFDKVTDGDAQVSGGPRSMRGPQRVPAVFTGK